MSVISAGITTLAFAVKSGDAQAALQHATAIAEGMGATIASNVALEARSSVLDTTREVVQSMSAARTQMRMPCNDDDYVEAVEDTQLESSVASRALSNYSLKVSRDNP